MVAYGIKNGSAKLTPAKAHEIRARFRKGVTKTQLAKTFNVSVRTVWNVLDGRAWADKPKKERR